MSKVEESTKAIQEVARFGQQALETLSGAGNFFNKVFGDLVVDGVGLLSDRLKYYRLDRLLELAKKVERKHDLDGVKDLRSISPKVGLPLLEGATLEDDEVVHDLWANLLANATNPEFKENITRTYVSILNDFTPTDAELLELMGQKITDKNYSDQMVLVGSVDIKDIRRNLDHSDFEIDMSVLNLERLGCIRPTGARLDLEKGILTNLTPLHSRGIEFIALTEIGYQLFLATR